MNSALKAKVLDMRNDGLSYAKISESMGLLINTIKYYKMICTKWIITVLVVQENTDFIKENVTWSIFFFFF